MSRRPMATLAGVPPLIATPTSSPTGYPWQDGDVLSAADLNAAFLPSSGGFIGGDLNVSGTLDVGEVISGPITASSLVVQDNITVAYGATSLVTLLVQAGTNLDGITTTQELHVQAGDNGIFASTDGGYLALNGSNFTLGGANLLLSGKGRPPYAFEFYWSGVRMAWWTTIGAFQIIGTASRPGGGAWVDSSDARIKTVTGDYAAGLDEVTQLRPVTFTYKGNDTFEQGGSSPHAKAAVDATPFVGLVAQEAEVVLPGMVTMRSGFIDGTAVDDLRILDTSELVFALVNAVKTLATRVAALEGGGLKAAPEA